MNHSNILCLLLLPLFVGACTSIKPAPTGAADIVVEAKVSRICGQGRVNFPAGVYKAEVVSAKGTYYRAPESLKTRGVLMGRAETGGIFVSNQPGNPQAAWFGDMSDTVENRPTTLFSAIGVAAPKLWPYTPRIPYQWKK